MLVLANLLARVTDAYVLYLQKPKQTQKKSGRASPRTSAYTPETGQFSKTFVLPLLPLIYCWFLSVVFETSSSLLPKQEAPAL